MNLERERANGRLWASEQKDSHYASERRGRFTAFESAKRGRKFAAAASIVAAFVPFVVLRRGTENPNARTQSRSQIDSQIFDSIERPA